MNPMVTTLLILVATMALFIWNRWPAAVVAVMSLLALYLTGVLTMHEALGGFGDPLIVFIAALLGIGIGLETTGVGTWAGQWLIHHAGKSRLRLIASLLILSAVTTALIGMNGAVVAMLPIAVIVCVQTRIMPSQLMMPVSIACLTGAKLTLLGSPVNVIAASAADAAGGAPIRFFEWSIVGLPLLAGSLVIILLFGPRLLPKRNSGSLPADFSRHAHTLVEQYRIADGVHRLRVRASSPLIGKLPGDIDVTPYPGLSVLGLLDDQDTELIGTAVAEGHHLLVRGDADSVGRLAGDLHLAIREPFAESQTITNALFNRSSGLAEVVIPPRSALVGQTVFPGMATHEGDLIVLAVQRGGNDVAGPATQLRVGDHLLFRGTWEALDKHFSDPQMLMVDAPQMIRRQTVALSRGAREAIVILLVLVVLLATNAVPAAVATLICVTAMVLTRVITLNQLYSIDWNTCVLVGGMIPLATAMSKTGLANLLGEYVIQVVGAGGPRALMAGLFLVAAALTQVISNNSAALVMVPIAVATAKELGVSATPLLIAVALGAGAAHLTPMSTPVNLVTYGPGAYQFGDYWKLGALIVLWSMTVVVVIAPLYWSF
ncbi:TrkA-C domain-containing protein [Paraburkholderia caballeronis]|uniref:TrkA-C domain-containing protein n=2 Tax=Paraburkholderia caballeronis TaxID=416943 RepID=A0A1H7LDN0_9BURK|nr:TrkA family protein [Paraburkholderia caballeronis]PXX03780.1 TrkA family protein [Paraburkholderia caballeronis]RAK04524.1 TrkA family protein [Paraburkholderia caballeronis]TDV39437.1 TrkA family protein [Paraburkholderia caballeronis]SED76536.1 TrkA-C domain-containing protein [Paraburkholderia caballeronis]